eukprot:scaffold1233_cov395-Prasinococcus_capsulatus_cf.AAC.45
MAKRPFSRAVEAFNVHVVASVGRVTLCVEGSFVTKKTGQGVVATNTGDLDNVHDGLYLVIVPANLETHRFGADRASHGERLAAGLYQRNVVYARRAIDKYVALLSSDSCNGVHCCRLIAGMSANDHEPSNCTLLRVVDHTLQRLCKRLHRLWNCLLRLRHHVIRRQEEWQNRPRVLLGVGQFALLHETHPRLTEDLLAAAFPRLLLSLEKLKECAPHVGGFDSCYLLGHAFQMSAAANGKERPRV